MKPLIISNWDPDADEVLYTNDRGSWNVSRALRDCYAGKHKTYLIDVPEAYEANRHVEVDEAKVRVFIGSPGVCTRPLLGIMEDGAMWLIDGHHRLRALHHIGLKEFPVFVIEEADSKPYIVWYNGQRKPPYKIEGQS